MKKKLAILLTGIVVFTPILGGWEDIKANQHYSYENLQIEGVDNFNQILVQDQNIRNSHGFAEMSFNTVGSNQGRWLNIYYRNDAFAQPALVQLQRRSGGQWVNVGTSFSVTNANAVTVPRAATANTEHRITITNTNGGLVNGRVAIRQTNTPVSFLELDELDELDELNELHELDELVN